MLDSFKYLLGGILLSVIFVNPSEADDFRGFDWGASPQDVIKKEGNQPDTMLGGPSSGFLMYPIKNGPGNDYHSILNYRFDSVSSKLDEGVYDNIARKPGLGNSAGVFLEDFEYFHEVLTDKYGQPIEKSKNYKFVMFKALPDRLALTAGWLVLVNAWLTPRTMIIQTLQKNDLGFSHRIRYIDRRAINRKAKEEKEWGELLKGFDPSIRKDL